MVKLRYAAYIGLFLAPALVFVPGCGEPSEPPPGATDQDVEDMEGIDEIFLEIGVAEPYIEPAEVERHQKGLSGAPENKREVVPENKKAKKEASKRRTRK